MKYIKLLLLTLLLIPNLAFGVVAVGWNATSTDVGYITPNAVNGNIPFIRVPTITTTSTSASSTFANGINITSGCVAIGGTCLTGGGGSVTAVTGTYPIISSGGTAPAISIAFGTTTTNTWSGFQQFNAGIGVGSSGVLINGGGAGNGTIVYPNTGSSATLTLPSTTGTLCLTSTCQATISVTSPITLTGASVGIVNQGTSAQVLHGNASGNASFGAIVNADITNGTIDLTTKVTGTLPILNGGTNNTVYPLNSLLYYNGTSIIATSSDPLWVGSIIGTSTRNSGIGSTTPWAMLSVHAQPGEPSFAVGSSSATSFVIDQSGFVGVGVANPLSLLTVSKQPLYQTPVSGSTAQFVGLDANPLRITYDTHNNSSTSGTALMFRRSRGTSATPLADIVDDVLGSVNFRGYGTTGYSAGSLGLMTAKAEGTFTDTSMPTAITFDTTPVGSVTATEKVRITGGGQVVVGSTTPVKLATVTVASSTPYFAITDTDAATDKKHWIESNIDGKLSFGTTTDQMTSTSTALSIEGSNATHVGVATSTSFTFGVAGTIGVTGITTAANGNAICHSTGGEVQDSGALTCALSSGFLKDTTGEVTFEVAKYIVKRMNAITFNYKGETEQHYGFIAEQVAQIDKDVKEKFNVDAHLAEYAQADTNYKVGDGTTHFFKKGDPISVQYSNYTAVLTKYLQGLDI